MKYLLIIFLVFLWSCTEVTEKFGENNSSTKVDSLILDQIHGEGCREETGAFFIKSREEYDALGCKGYTIDFEKNNMLISSWFFGGISGANVIEQTNLVGANGHSGGNNLFFGKKTETDSSIVMLTIVEPQKCFKSLALPTTIHLAFRVPKGNKTFLFEKKERTPTLIECKP